MVPAHRCIAEAQEIPDLGGDSAGTAPSSLHPSLDARSSERSGARLSLDPGAAFSSQRELPGLVLCCPGKINIQRLLSAPFCSFPLLTQRRFQGQRCGGSGWGEQPDPKGVKVSPPWGIVTPCRTRQVPESLIPQGLQPLKTPGGRGSPREVTPTNDPGLIINPINHPAPPEETRGRGGHTTRSRCAPLDAPALSPHLLVPRVSMPPPAAVRFGMGKWSLGSFSHGKNHHSHRSAPAKSIPFAASCNQTVNVRIWNNRKELFRLEFRLLQDHRVQPFCKIMV